jgi:hypothetical protein
VEKRVLCCALGAFLVLAVAVRPCSRLGRPVDTSRWGLVEFTDHLNAAGLQLHVVPAREDGKWSNSIYLAEDPDTTWRSLQGKNRNVEHAEQWKGVLWVEHLLPEAYTEWYVSEWGANGCQVGRFVVFGDERLVARLRKAFNR